MAEDLQRGQKSSFSYLELANRPSQPGDIRSDRAGLVIVGSELFIYSEGNYAKTSKIVKVSLSGGNADTISFAWQNPESAKIIVKRVIMRVTTAGGTGATMDVGVVSGATGTADTIFDGVAIESTGIKDSLNSTDAGTNGVAKAIVVDENGGTNDYITGKILGADSPNLAGEVYIEYIKV